VPWTTPRPGACSVRGGPLFLLSSFSPCPILRPKYVVLQLSPFVSTTFLHVLIALPPFPPFPPLCQA